MSSKRTQVQAEFCGAASLEGDARRHRQIIDSVRDYAILTTDAQGTICTWNRGAEEILGYTEIEILGQSLSLLFTQEDVEAGIARQEAEIARRDGSANDERWHQKKDGSRFWASGVLTAFFDEAGQLQGYCKVMRDITHRREYEQQSLAQRIALAERERESAVLAEHNRMAQEIHDTLAQGFTGIFLQLEAAEDALESDSTAAGKHIVKARNLAQQSLQEARRSVQTLLPSLQGKSPVSSLSQALQELLPLNASYTIRLVLPSSEDADPSDNETYVHMTIKKTPDAETADFDNDASTKKLIH